MNPLIQILLLLVMGYLIGAIPFAVIVAKAHGVDIFKVGSGNPGATNVGRVLGSKWGYLVFAGDVLKGLVPAVLARFFYPADQPGIILDHQGIWAMVAFAAVAGHVASPYIGFRGGKGVATGVGAVLGISPVVALTSFAVFLIVVAISRYVSLASVIAVLSAIPLAIVFHEPRTMLVLYVLAGFMIIYRHRSNMKRLMRGEESKYEFRKKRPAMDGEAGPKDDKPQNSEPLDPSAKSQT